MLDLKRLYGFSQKHLSDMMGEKLNDFRLEQAENTSDGNWDVVVSFLMHNVNAPETNGSIFSGSHLPFERVFKRLLLDTDGELIKYLIYNEER